MNTSRTLITSIQQNCPKGYTPLVVSPKREICEYQSCYPTNDNCADSNDFSVNTIAYEQFYCST